MAPIPSIAWMMAAGGAPLALSAIWEGGALIPSMSAAAFCAVAHNVMIAGVICVWAFYKWVGLVPTSVTAISSLIVPVVGVLTGMAALGETSTAVEWTALVLIASALGTVLLKPAGATASGPRNSS